MHPLFDETALERVRLPGCLGVLGGRGRRRGEPSRLLQCRRSAAGSDKSSVRLWLGPLSQFPVQSQPLHREKERGAAGLEETCWFPNAQGGRLHNHSFWSVHLKRAVPTCCSYAPCRVRLSVCLEPILNTPT